MPKALYEKIAVNPGESLACKAFRSPAFTVPWHFHPECELTLIVQGRGTRYVGDSIARFGDGDLVFMGPNLPHYWWKDADDRREAGAVVLQFDEGIAGGAPFDLPEGTLIRRLLGNARRGVVFSGTVRDRVAARLIDLPGLQPWARFCGLLEILGLLAESAPFRWLASEGYAPELDENDGKRLTAVSRYVHESFHSPISQPHAAGLAGLSPAAFSRYFHKRMGRTFETYVNEVRIGHASRLLRETENTVAEIAFSCGFNNLSNFNRRFLQFRRVAPTKYRRGVAREDEK
jgi:AraC-like DNA-binding protein